MFDDFPPDERAHLIAEAERREEEKRLERERQEWEMEHPPEAENPHDHAGCSECIADNYPNG